MRSEIIKVYKSKTWHERVKHMPDSQVVAIYKSFERKGKFKSVQNKQSDYHQITLGEYLETKGK